MLCGEVTRGERLSLKSYLHQYNRDTHGRVTGFISGQWSSIPSPERPDKEKTELIWKNSIRSQCCLTVHFTGLQSSAVGIFRKKTQAVFSRAEVLTRTRIIIQSCVPGQVVSWESQEDVRRLLSQAGLNLTGARCLSGAWIPAHISSCAPASSPTGRQSLSKAPVPRGLV